MFTPYFQKNPFKGFINLPFSLFIFNLSINIERFLRKQKSLSQNENLKILTY